MRGLGGWLGLICMLLLLLAAFGRLQRGAMIGVFVAAAVLAAGAVALLLRGR